ncbi:MAG: cell surface protein SprA [Bacteroidota bacterium]
MAHFLPEKGDATTPRYPSRTTLSREIIRFIVFMASIGSLYSLMAFRYPAPNSKIFRGEQPPPLEFLSGNHSTPQDTVPPPGKVNTDTLASPEENNDLEVDTTEIQPEENINEESEDSLIHSQDTVGNIRTKGEHARFSKGLDTLTARKDTTEKPETTYVVFKDSTNRIKQFHYRRTPSPAGDFFPHEQYPLFLDFNSPAYQRTVSLDTTGSFVTVHEKFNGVDIKVPVTVPLDEYVKRRFKEESANNWRTLAHEYKTSKRGDDLAGLFGTITNISIPVPANPLFSIFGKNEIDLHVNGEVAIHAAFQKQSSDQTTISSLDQSQSTPNFNQEVQITVNGLIGDKLKIGADWNTQRTFEYENQLKINYTGYDDEVVQSIEAGNVSLTNTPSLIGGGQALFGIKTRLQSGPLSLTALVSQKKGQTKEVDVSGGSSQRPIEIRPQDYATNNFFIDTLYRRFFNRLYAQVVPQLNDSMRANQIVEISVWMTQQQFSSNQDRRNAVALINLPPHPIGTQYDSSFLKVNQSDISSGRAEQGYFTRLTTDKYKLNATAGFIEFKDNSIDGQAVAVSYRITSAPNDETVYGDFTPDTTRPLILKLIKPRNLQPSYQPSWDMQMKNIYNIGPDIKKDGFSLDVIYRQPGATDNRIFNNVALLQAVGFDKYASDGSTPTPDGKFDFIPGITIDQAFGNIIFPTLRPFDTDLKNYYSVNQHITLTDSLLMPEIYDTTKVSLQYIQKNFFVMQIVAATAVQSRISLGGFNIVEGSVQVLLNGSPLTPGEDYTVDYIVGEVTLKSERALQPGANISVKYEQNDLFQLASKTLMGARGVLDISPNVNMGFTIMNLTQASLSDKVRVGEEPTKNTIMGVDGGFNSNLPFLTSALDALPLIHAREMSTISFRGEGAYIIPNANTRTSTIEGDNNQSVAYIDDFEGSKRTIPFPISFNSWVMASPPWYSLLDTTIERAIVPDTPSTYSKCRLLWYNNGTGVDQVNVHEIWPNKSVATQDQFISILNLNYDPDRRGMYNYSPNLDSTLHRSTSPKYSNVNERRKNWNGIMKYIGTTTGDLVGQNMQYLEIWVNPQGDTSLDLRKGRLYVDLGRISEDIIPNGVLNSEDIIPTPSNPTGIPTGRVQPGADLGLDMLSDEQERTVFANFVNSNKGDLDVDPNDPSGDDFSYATGGTDFTHYNGTENNYTGGSPAGRFPDTEDLNGNSYLDQVNSYLEYEVPLAHDYIDSANVKRTNPYWVGGTYDSLSSTNDPKTSWYQLRIPLRNKTRLVSPGNPQTDDAILQNVQYVRFWFSGFEKPLLLRIAQMNLVGNQWAEAVPNDSTFKVSVVNIEDNPEYSSPPGVIRPLDRTRPDQTVYGNEQSLSLLLYGVPQGQDRLAVKVNTGRAIDVFSYKTMKMFVHGDNSFLSTPQHHDAEVYLRFGADLNNYYEYRLPIQPGWFEMTIDFGQLTTIKSVRDHDKNARVDSLYRSGPYGIRGRPALTSVLYFAVGVYNPVAPNGKPFLGTFNGIPAVVWVNELRLVNVDNSTGYAYHFDTQLKLSDMGNVSVNYAYQDPNFHSIEDRLGDRITHQNWALNTNFSFDKYFPTPMQGSSLSLAYSHQEQITKPKYLPGTDILVSAAAQSASATASGPGAANAGDSVTVQSQSLHVSDSYSIGSFRIVLPWKVWYIDETFNKLSYSFSYNKSSDRNPTILSSKAWSWAYRMSYGITIPGDPSIQPFKSIFGGVPFFDSFKEWKLYYIPISSLSTSLDATRSSSVSINRDLNIVPTLSRAFNANKTFSFGWRTTDGGLLNLSGDYGLSIARDLLFLDTDSSGRGFSRIMRDMFIGGRDGSYSQRITFTPHPKIPDIFDIPKYFDLSAGYGVNYDWRNIFQSGDLGKSAHWGNNITLSTTLRLKSLAEAWFGSFDTPSQPEVAQPAAPVKKDTTAKPPSDLKDSKDTKDTKGTKGAKDTTSTAKKGQSLLAPLKKGAKYLIKIPFLDYETIAIQFSQQNSSANGGILGATGFGNLWLRSPFQGSTLQYGPSRLYQLGLISDPSGFLEFHPSSKFPFLSWTTIPGLRAPLGSMTDQYSQSNSIALHTTRPLWEGASLEVNWKVGWSYNKQTIINTNALGVDSISSVLTSGHVERSFLTLPPVFFLKYLNSNLQDVGKKFGELKNIEPSDIALTDAFERGLEAAPFLNKVLGQYVPRANWTLRWDGLQKISFLGSAFKQLTLDHSYNSTFSKDFVGNPDGTNRTNTERITYAFNPLVGLTGTPKDLLGGNVSGSFKYGTSTIYDLNFSAQNITETSTQDISFALNYGRHGFSLPFFGVNLVNDVDITFTYSLSKNSRRLYDPNLLEASPDGTPLEGTTRTTMEPRFRYGLSSRVTASLFFRYTSIKPDEGGSTIFGTSTSEAGVDINISIQ